MSIEPPFVCFSRLGKLGKLGNQLFQVAATLGTANQHDAEAKFPQWKYSEYFVGPFNQTLSPAEISTEFIEPRASYSPIPFSPNLDLFGFFQSEKYFAHCSKTIRRTLAFKEGLLPDALLNESSDCAIHVRRTDYTVESHRFVPLQMDYYSGAINLMRERGCTRFLVFSDDPDWCERHLSQQGITIVSGLNEIQSLCLMSRCKNHIIANSTFSWWGSWLCDNPEKFVVAPSTWYGFQFSVRQDTNYQYCENWTLLPHKLSVGQQVVSLLKSTKKKLFFLPAVSRELWLKAELEEHAREQALTSP
jgi:hypothetical protein